jgi:hypothetical protein
LWTKLNVSFFSLLQTVLNKVGKPVYLLAFWLACLSLLSLINFFKCCKSPKANKQYFRIL